MYWNNIMELHGSIGTLKYFHNHNYWAILEIDQSITDYYSSLIPKYIQTNRQKYTAHISVVRKEIPINLEVWGKYENERVEFFYNSIIHHGNYYYWINCWSKRLEEIREELGLSNKEYYTEPPDGFIKTFHTTISNIKETK